ncbi:MAG: YceD family protein [Candidatus Parabeggiatoa sp.]|nr:YceD family protein [Candidatus Parabeggiatoa sp.]
MLKELPTLIEPVGLAFQGKQLKGQVSLMQMSRLHDSLCEVGGEVYIDWLFTTDDKQRPTVIGSVQTLLKMICQRCLQPMQWPIDAKVALIILKNGQTEDELPVGYEALTLTSTQVSLITLIENELILALPIVARHTTCPSNEYQLAENFNKDLTYQNNPFHVLSELKLRD